MVVKKLAKKGIKHAMGPGLKGTPKNVMKNLRSQRKLRQKIEKQDKVAAKSKLLDNTHIKSTLNDIIPSPRYPGEPNPETAWRYHHRKPSSLNAPWAQSESNKASLINWKKSGPSSDKLRITPYVKQKGPSQPRDAPQRNTMIKNLNKRFTPEDILDVNRPEYIRKKKNPNWKIRLGPLWGRSGLKGAHGYSGGLPSDTKWGNRKGYLFDLVGALEGRFPRRPSDVRI